MKLGDKVLIKESISLVDVKGTLLCSIPGDNPKIFLVKIHYVKPLYLILKDSEFSRIEKNGNISLLTHSICKEQGACGTIVNILPRSRYLCEFQNPFCNIELTEEEIIKWDPENGVFALLNTVKLSEDIPEHNLKKGMHGVIILVFFEPSLAYDVEFYFEGKKPEFDSFTFLPHQLEFVADHS